jgi:hypothetical protein
MDTPDNAFAARFKQPDLQEATEATEATEGQISVASVSSC